MDAFSHLRKNSELSEMPNCEVMLSGKAVGEMFIQLVTDMQLDLSHCVGQGYDGACALSSDRVGAAAVILKQAQNAHFYHCTMHCLNLNASKAVSIPAVRHAQDVVMAVSACFRSSAKRSDVLKSCILQAEQNTESTKSHLVTLCTTRFVERHIHCVFP